jgi:hypothetical protein
MWRVTFRRRLATWTMEPAPPVEVEGVDVVGEPAAGAHVGFAHEGAQFEIDPGSGGLGIEERRDREMIVL